MGRFTYGFLHSFARNFSKGVRPVSSLAQKKFWSSPFSRLASSPRFLEWSKPLGSLFFLFFAVTLAYWANRMAQDEAEENWHKSHYPSFEVIRWVLASQELKRVENEKQLARIQRELPTTLEEEGAFWVTQDGDWVYSLAHTEEVVPFFAFCRLCSVQPQKWLQMGKGWKGLEQMTEWLQKTRKAQSKAGLLRQGKIKGAGHSWRDPREIRY